MDKIIDLAISIDELEGWRYVQCSGNFIVNSIPLARKKFDELQSGDNGRVALDLTRVTDFDAAAMCMVLNFNRELLRKNGNLVLIGPGQRVREAFARIGFDSAVRIFDSADLFVASLIRPRSGER
jgi:anti-anti-sigma factor